jgi:protein-L-isoaspartate(D-aspartate) O-methyltransferase
MIDLMDDDRTRRERMVECQILRRGVRDPRVLAVLREVPRHLFVPDNVRDDAYDDRPLPIGEGQTISQPYMVASMTEALQVQPTDRVLEIGTGSGYQSAILARLAGQVISIERQALLAVRADAVLRAIGVSNVVVIVADGSEGYEPGGPYDRILVTAGAPAVPFTLKAQLIDGGRLVIPVGPVGLQVVTIVDRQADRYVQRESEGCVFVPLIGRHAWDPALNSSGR